jgi:hypothetical protein
MLAEMFDSDHPFSNLDTLVSVSPLIFIHFQRDELNKVGGGFALNGTHEFSSKGVVNADPRSRPSIRSAAVAPLAGLHVYGGLDPRAGDGREYFHIYGVQPGIAADHARSGAG